MAVSAIKKRSFLTETWYAQTRNLLNVKLVKLEMEFQMVASILANEYVIAFGYLVGVVSGCIAIYQTIQVTKKNTEIQQLKITVNELNTKITNNITTNRNNVSQGERSQFFQENNGPVNIDNRG